MLRLVRIFFNSLYASYLDRKYYLHRLEKLHHPHRREFTEPNDLLELYSLANDMIGQLQNIIDEKSRDLYEFFYDDIQTVKDGYYCFQFPINYESFKKKRVPKPQMKELMKDPAKNAREICVCLEKNIAVFYDMLRLKRKGYLNLDHDMDDTENVNTR